MAPFAAKLRAVETWRRFFGYGAQYGAIAGKRITYWELDPSRISPGEIIAMHDPNRSTSTVSI